ncbi:hypothetical protein [Streptomyces sp. NPDC091371]|uniref:hypothetical protein n=1 Tax=Streptomyces sp. NPDC091371 TaxID=3155303 RepID=UPI0034230811
MSGLYESTAGLYVDELGRAGAHPLMVTHKWERPDLIAPHSDLDLRLILDAAPASWEEFNGSLATAHTAAVAVDSAHGRLLEHPPGFAFTAQELDEGLVQGAEVTTWSLLHGQQERLGTWAKAAEVEPWTASDSRFYRALLRARVGGRYRLSQDATDNVHWDVIGYLRHCVAWHYVAPCWFAAACLATRSRLPGKLVALTAWRPGSTVGHAERFAAHAESDPQPREDPRQLLRHAHAAVDAAMRHICPPDADPPEEDPRVGRARAWTMAVGMLRVKPARWWYYLNPPPGVATGYLIAREAKELSTAAPVLARLAEQGTAAEGRMAGAMAAVLPPPGTPTTTQVLRELLDRWRAAGSAVEDFLTGPTPEN